MITRIVNRAEQRSAIRALRRRADLVVAPSARIGRVVVQGSGARGRLIVGARSVIEDGAILVLTNGGSLELGEDVRIRTGAVLNISGRCRFEGKNLLSWYSVVHCAYDVSFEEMAGTGEAVTVVDSIHYHGEIGAADEHWYGNHRPGAVRIGRNSWLASRSTIAGTVQLGARVTVAGSAFVASGSYPDRSVLRGVPARWEQPS